MSPKENPALRANAGSRAEVIRTSHAIARAEREADFAVIYLARRFGLAIPLAHTIAALANLGRALG